MGYGIFFEHSTASTEGILLPNHLASSIQGATGDRAQYLTQILHKPVIAYERPSTANQPELPPFKTPESYIENVTLRAKKIQRLLGDLGIKEVIIMGTSAGGLDALAMAATGEIAVKQVIVAEAVGMKEVPKREKVKYYRSLLLQRDTGFGHSEETFESLEEVRGKDSGIQWPGKAKKEAAAYWSIYTSNIGLDFLEAIATDTPDIPVDVILAENSPTTTPDIQRQMQEEFRETSINIEIIPNAQHSFINPHSHFMYFMQKAIRSTSGYDIKQLS